MLWAKQSQTDPTAVQGKGGDTYPCNPEVSAGTVGRHVSLNLSNEAFLRLEAMCMSLSFSLASVEKRMSLYPYKG